MILEKDMVILSAHQPAYLPWLGYFHKLLLSDVFVILDSVQFEKNSFINRNKVRTREGWTWLTVPLLTKGHLDKTINDMEWDTRSEWRRKHLETLRQCYSKTAYFSTYFPQIENMLTATSHFSDLLMDIFLFFADLLGARAKILRLSDMAVTDKKSDLILTLCHKVGASCFVAGELGANYLSRTIFEQAGIDLYVQKYVHPEYAQAYPGFEPYMGIVDCVFNHGAERSREIIYTGNLTQDALRQNIELKRI